jgi:hypothetical protein
MKQWFKKTIPGKDLAGVRTELVQFANVNKLGPGEFHVLGTHEPKETNGIKLYSITVMYYAETEAK